MDQNTPRLKGIIIKGTLIVDDSDDRVIDVEYIIISPTGTLQIGTEDEPFTHNLDIKFRGSPFDEPI